jgi:hypothetical protein
MMCTSCNSQGNSALFHPSSRGALSPVRIQPRITSEFRFAVADRTGARFVQSSGLVVEFLRESFRHDARFVRILREHSRMCEAVSACGQILREYPARCTAARRFRSRRVRRGQHDHESLVRQGKMR